MAVYSYLNERGRAGFVMSSQASSAGRDEAKVRQKLIETGAVDVMIAIRGNFFYTRPLACELWFLSRAKVKKHKDKVLMIDAHNIYHKVTRKIYDFSPEQLQNLLAVVWLYRGEEQRFLDLVAGYLTRTLAEARACFEGLEGESVQPLPDYVTALEELRQWLKPFLESAPKDGAHVEAMTQLAEGMATFKRDVQAFRASAENEQAHWEKQTARTAAALVKATERMAPLAETSRDLVKDADLLYKLASRLIDLCETDLNGRESELWPGREIAKARKAADLARHEAVEQLKQVRYFHRQTVWLTERFPEGKLHDVPGLVKLVDRAELEVNDWSLTPGRYVDVAPEEVDEDFDFEEALRDIHIELQGLNAEATELAARITKNFEELGA